ncbi:hypothetical protein M0Q28_06745 [Patescibacteria group bacterium]|jgi:hypothetical protein|nr:hypothetical protein [Patescibacteria group bacterium]
MAYLPPFESLFPLSDDLSGMTLEVMDLMPAGEAVVDVPLGYLSARVLDFDGCEMPQRVGEQ